MSIEYVEKMSMSLGDFKAWSGAIDRLETIKRLDRVDQAEMHINAMLEGQESDVEATHINDILWFEMDELIADWEREEPIVKINEVDRLATPYFNAGAYAVGHDFLELVEEHEEGESYLELTVWAYKEPGSDSEVADHVEYLVGIRDEHGDLNHLEEGDHESRPYETADEILERYKEMFREEFRRYYNI